MGEFTVGWGEFALFGAGGVCREWVTLQWVGGLCRGWYGVCSGLSVGLQGMGGEIMQGVRG